MDPAVTSAQVDTEADGSLLVRWEIEGHPVSVDIASGPTPECLDHRHQVTVAAGQTSWRLASPAGGRLFVSVARHGSGPAVASTDRRIAFRGITNFRDLGGYRTRLDAVLRWGTVFRADSLHGLLAEDMALYQQLGLRTVYDLRGDLERARNPNRGNPGLSPSEPASGHETSFAPGRTDRRRRRADPGRHLQGPGRPRRRPDRPTVDRADRR